MLGNVEVTSLETHRSNTTVLDLFCARNEYGTLGDLLDATESPHLPQWAG